MKAPIKDNIFNSGALISKAPIVINIFILFILFYSGQFFFWRQDCHLVVNWTTNRSSPLLKYSRAIYQYIYVYEINHWWKFKSFCQEYVKISSSVNLANEGSFKWQYHRISLKDLKRQRETSIKLILTEKVNYIRVTAEPKIIFLWIIYRRNK